MSENNILITNIERLYQVRPDGAVKLKGAAMTDVPFIDNAFLLIKSDNIEAFGAMDDLHKGIDFLNVQMIDAKGSSVLPAYCDAHTHIVFAEWRAQEFADRIAGFSYQDIAARGGGILNSVQKLRVMDETVLFEKALERLHNMQSMGTGAVEIKSGYGLSVDSELKMLRVIRRLKESTRQTIKATFLGAHAIPPEFKNNKDGYLHQLINDMLPRIASEGLADYCDIFCEQNYFTSDDTMRLLDAAAAYGLRGKVHAEQLSHSGGIDAGVKSKAISVDHLEYISDNDISTLLDAETMPVLLPGAAFFLSLKQPPARKMLDAGLPVALSTDYNPGTCPSGNMSMMMSLACVDMRLTPGEAYNASTVNSAYAMGVEDVLGSVTIGKKANLIITQPGIKLDHIPYLFASTHFIKQVII